MFKVKRFYEEDDGASGGAGDPATDKPVEKSTAEVVKSAVEAVGVEFRKALETVGKSADSKPAPVTVDVEALKAEAAKVNAQVDELMAEGRGSEALRIRDEFLSKVARTTQTSPADNPLVAAGYKHGRKAAQASYPELFKTYGPELEAYVKSLPVERQIDPDVWDEAAERVRGRHFDDIAKSLRDAAVDEARRSFSVPPTPGGSRGSREVGGVKLSEEAELAIEVTGVSREAYAAQVKMQEEFDKLPLRQRGAWEGYPIVPQNETIQPGRF